MGYASLDDESPRVELFPIAQILDLRTVEERTSLPSYTYLAPDTLATGSLDLPWAQQRNFAVGEFARRNAAESPERTVSAAKSWLCHGGVDRRAAILPWNAPDDGAKNLTLVASQRYLEHLIAAWQASLSRMRLWRSNKSS